MTDQYLDFLKYIKDKFNSKRILMIIEFLISYVEKDQIEKLESFIHDMDKASMPPKEEWNDDQRNIVELYAETKKYIRWCKLSRI